MSLGASGGYLWLPGSAVALGERAYAGGEEAIAYDPEIQTAVPRESGSVFPSHSEHFVTHDDRGQRADAARDGRALLHGLVAHAADRPATHHRVFLVHLRVLRRSAAGVVPENLEARVLLS